MGGVGVAFCNLFQTWQYIDAAQVLHPCELRQLLPTTSPCGTLEITSQIVARDGRWHFLLLATYQKVWAPVGRPCEMCLAMPMLIRCVVRCSICIRKSSYSWHVVYTQSGSPAVAQVSEYLDSGRAHEGLGKYVHNPQSSSMTEVIPTTSL